MTNTTTIRAALARTCPGASMSRHPVNSQRVAGFPRATTSSIAAVCLLAAACAGEGPTARTAESPRATAGTERAAAQPSPSRAGAEAPIDDSLAGLTRTGSAIVHDEDDAIAVTPLPSSADPLDRRPRGAPPAAVALTTDDVCPAGMRGLDARVVDVPGGAALVLTADDVEELRMRVTRFSELQRAHAEPAELEGAEPTPAPPESYAEPRFLDPDAKIVAAPDLRLIEIPGGARLEVRMESEEEIGALRRELREDAEALTQGRCPLSLQIEA